MVLSATLSLRCPAVARPSARARPASRRLAVAPRASLSDVGKYLSEAMSQIFTPTHMNDTPWEGTGSGFTGKIAHHEEPARLRQLYDMVEQMKLEMEASGQVDPQAVGKDTEPIPTDDAGMQQYMTQAVARLFGHNFKGDEAEPKEWASGGYTHSWRGGSRREVQRQYDRLVRFQKVVKSTMEKAETANAK